MQERTYRYTVGHAFEAAALANPSRPALILTEGCVSYAELNERSDRLARWLLSRGLTRGRVVAIAHTKTVDAYATMLACLKLGIVYCNIDDSNPAERLKRIFATCQPALVVGERLPEGVRSAAAQCGAEPIEFAEGSSTAD